MIIHTTVVASTMENKFEMTFVFQKHTVNKKQQEICFLCSSVFSPSDSATREMTMHRAMIKHFQSKEYILLVCSSAGYDARSETA